MYQNKTEVLNSYILEELGSAHRKGQKAAKGTLPTENEIYKESDELYKESHNEYEQIQTRYIWKHKKKI